MVAIKSSRVGRYLSSAFALSLILGIFCATPSFSWSSAQVNVSFFTGSGSKTPYQSVLDSGGNIITFGAFTGTVDFDPSASVNNLTASTTDIYITKLSSTGNFIWAKQLANTGGASYGFHTSLTIDSSGNIFISGRFSGAMDINPGVDTVTVTSNGSTDIFYVKLSNDGNFLWGNSIGSADADYAFTSTVDSSGNFYFAGCFVGTSDFNASASTAYLTESTGGSNTDIYIEKLSSSGTFVWVKQVVGNGGGCAYGLGADASGNVYLFGNDSGNTDLDPGTGTAIVTSAGMEDIFILKLDSSGNYVWGKSTGGTSTERPNAIAVDPSGNVYATGYFTGTTDLDPSASAANFVGDPSYLTEYIFKWNTNGIYQWGAALSPTGTSSSGYAVAVDSIGSVYVVGRFSGTSDFDPSAGTSTLTNVGGDDGSIWKLSSSGAFLWAKQVGSTSSDGAAGIVITSDDRSIVTGTYSGAADLDTGPATVTFTPSSTDVYIMKLNSNGISTMIREASSLTLSLSTGNLTATKGRTVTITVVASTAGKVTIYADGRKLPKCIDLNISSTSVTCSWTPNVRKSISLTASFNPTDNAFLASSANLSVGVSSRTGTR